MAYGFNNDKSRVPVYESSVADTTFAKKIHTILGQYNIDDPNEDYAIILGNGTSDNDKSNAMTIGWDGEMRVYSPVMSKDRTPSTTEYTYFGSLYDADGNMRLLLQTADFTNSKQGIALRTQRKVNGNNVFNGFDMTIDSNGDRYVTLNDPVAWQKGIGLSEGLIESSVSETVNILIPNTDASYNATIANHISRCISGVDPNNKAIGRVTFRQQINGTKIAQLEAHGYDSSNNSVWNALSARVYADGTRGYSVDDPKAFRNAIGLDNCTVYNTVSNYFTANTTNIKDVSGSMIVWGNVATFYINFKNKNAISVPANGNISNLNLGTLKDGFRPKNSLYTCGGDTGGGINGYYLTSNGTVELASSDSTGAARTIAADSTFCVGVTYLLS